MAVNNFKKMGRKVRGNTAVSYHFNTKAGYTIFCDHNLYWNTSSHGLQIVVMVEMFIAFVSLPWGQLIALKKLDQSRRLPSFLKSRNR